jgi:hypothetical protein
MEPGGFDKDNQARRTRGVSPSRLDGRSSARRRCARETPPVCYKLLIAQDSWLADEFLGGSATALFGVFDGHGLDGRKVSNAIAARLPKLLAECPDFQARGPPVPGAALAGASAGAA